ncbi:MAG: glycogen synthase [Mogibacterium sp.]|nr:glycogen synthase [Mogibacterium sp.]
MNILYATPECVPFASSGGLGEVAGSLPKALNRKRRSKIDCRVILPLYAKVPQSVRDKMTFLGSDMVRLVWRRQYMGLFEYRQDGVTYYFIDNEYYFNRDALYGHYDDGERFAFFSKAIFHALKMMPDFRPDILHANDWQTALVPVLQTAVYRLEDLKTVYSVHNIEYQGYYGKSFNDEVLGLPQDAVHLIEWRDGLNLMKGGIECCNYFSTVSPSYAQELKDPAYAFGLEEIVRKNDFKLGGILNGINRTLYDPEKDPQIAANYSAKDLSGKAVCKQALQEEAGLPVRADVPLLTLISRLVPAKGLDLVRMVMDDVLNNFDAQFLLLGTGFPEYEEFFRELEERHPDKARCMIKFDPALSHRIYAGGDMILVPSRSEPCGLTQMIGCRYANVPIVRETGGLGDSIHDCTLGDGNGFTFHDYDASALYAAIANAISRYQDSENWQKLQQHDLREDFGWSVSAEDYRLMYLGLYE